MAVVEVHYGGVFQSSCDHDVIQNLLFVCIFLPQLISNVPFLWIVLLGVGAGVVVVVVVGEAVAEEDEEEEGEEKEVEVVIFRTYNQRQYF